MKTITILVGSYFGNIRNTLDVMLHNEIVGALPAEFDVLSLAEFKRWATMTLTLQAMPHAQAGDPGTITFNAAILDYIDGLTVDDTPAAIGDAIKALVV